MRSRFWWKYARGRRSIKGISQTLLPARCFTTECFIFLFIYLFIEQKYRRKIFRVLWRSFRNRGRMRRRRETINETRNKFFSFSNKCNSKRKFNFYWKGKVGEKANRAVRNFWRILDFRANIEQFSCRKKCDGYWTRVWQWANIKVFYGK